MRISSRTAWAALPVLALVTLAGCSSEGPAQELTLRQGTTRAVELIDQRGDATRTVKLKVPTRAWYLRMDCIGDEDGEIVVAIGGVGEGAIGCSTKSLKRGGLIILTGPKGSSRSDVDVEVRVPKGARWSAAVDVRPDAE